MLIELLETLAERSKVVTPDPNQGIKVKHWFWAALDTLAPKGGRKIHHTSEPVDKVEANPASSAPLKTPEAIIAENPMMGPSTLLNVLKAEGYEITKKEADASSTFIAQTREAAAEKKGTLFFRTHLIESSYKDNGIGPTKFRVVLLKEGMGNPRDAYYYSRDALVSAVPVFEGKKIYADHPSLTEEETRPERSVRDILGYFENIGVEELPDGCHALVGDVNILPDKPYEWARALLRNSVDYAKKFPDKEFVGLSINANGDAEESDIESVLKSAPEGAQDKLSKALEAGQKSVRVVSKISEAVSCDLVTEAGAGGKIISLLEADKMENEMKQVEAEMEKKEAEAEMEKKEADPEHSDEEQDIELIKKMLDQYLGDHGEEEVQAAKEAMEMAMKHGDSKEEAMKCAGYAMKMARHMQKTKEAEKCEEEPKEEKKKEAEIDSEKKKESAEIIRLKGENAKLRESLNAVEIEKHLDETLKESGLRMEITKKFRALVGAPKTKKEIDDKFKVFVEGYRNAIGSESDSYEWLATSTEKASVVIGDNGVVDLSDC